MSVTLFPAISGHQDHTKEYDRFMSGITPARASQVDPALIEAMLRRRKSTPVLYWRLRRPRAHVYATAAATVAVYRLAAAVAMIVALALASFLGAFAGDIGYPRWPPVKEIYGMVPVAGVQAGSSIGGLAPVIAALGIVLVIIPRHHQWLFRAAMLTSIAIGYYRSILPQLPWSELSHEINGRTAIATRFAFPDSPSASRAISIASIVIVVFIGIVFYANSYSLAIRARDLIPRRPRNHSRSTFTAVSVSRRMAATAVTATLLAVDFWLVEGVRMLLPEIRSAAPYHWHVQFSLTDWILLAVAAAIVVCAPRPNGHRWLLVALLMLVTVFAFWPQNTFPPPAGFPGAPHRFWPLVIAYFLVTGIAFDLVTALLDWAL